MARTRRRRRAKPSIGRSAGSKRIRRHETFRSMNWIGNGAAPAFLAIPVLGLILINQTTLQVTVPAGALCSVAAAMTGAFAGAQQVLRRRR